jgi:FixJ family two-component response regulator
MPAMNGRELSENLQSLYPHLKTLFMSGYPADILAYKDVLEDGISFIAKPFSKDELALKIREALTEGNRSQGLYSAKQFLLTKSKPFH